MTDQDRVCSAVVVRALADADPVYDSITCFFCGALVPIPAEDRGPAWQEDSHDHADDCPYWMARQLLELPPWPESLLVE